MNTSRKAIRWQRVLYFGFIPLALSCLSSMSCAKEGTVDSARNLSEKDLSKALRRIIARRHVPAMAAALVRADGTIVQASAGEAVVGSKLEIDAGSRFHIGSTAKSMTAILLASLVAEGKLSWDTTLAEALPDLPMRAEYKKATLYDLLLNRAGIIAFQRTDLEDPAVVKRLWAEIPAASPEPREQRRATALYALSLPPVAPPGTKYIYSNVGWAIAGHIAEIAGDMTYEDLLIKRVFAPLGMSSSRIGGWPASAQEPNQPRGHYPPSWFLGRPQPQPLQDPYTFPAWMNPAGGVNCTIGDYALYALEYLRGARGEGMLLDAAGYGRILAVHARVAAAEMYYGSKDKGQIQLGYGWVVYETPAGTAFAADGSGGTFYARLGLLPDKGIAFAALANAGHAEPAITDTQVLLTRVKR